MTRPPGSPGAGETGGKGPSDDEDPRADLRWGTIPALVADVTRRWSGVEAVVDGSWRITYGELGARVQAFSRALVAEGVAPAEPVALWAPNCAEWVVAALGILGAGGVLVTVNTRFKGAEAALVLRSAGVRRLLTVAGFLGVDYPAMLCGQDLGELATIVVLRREGRSVAPAPRGIPFPGAAGEDRERREPVVVELEELLARGAEVDPGAVLERADGVAPDDVADILYTSGTTGSPKGVMTTHAQCLRTYGAWAALAGLAAGDRYLVVSPFFHTFGYKAGLLASLMVGATVYPQAVFAVDEVLARIEAERISVLPGPPTLYQAILDHPARARTDLSSLRLVTTGAAVVPVELVVKLRDELGIGTVLTAYGLTESCGTVTMCRRGDPADVVARTAGRALAGTEVKVVDPEGRARPPGQPGEVLVRGYNVMRGYVGDPAATASAIDPGGWLHTGDVGVLDQVGNVTITDRLKDMFVVGGFNAYPAEIEGFLRACPLVAQVAVIGVPDHKLGEVGCAFVVPAAQPTAEVPAEAGAQAIGRAVLAWARQAMANYKVPRHVVVVEALPLNAGGKVAKPELRERFAAGADRARTATLAEVRGAGVS